MGSLNRREFMAGTLIAAGGGLIPSRAAKAATAADGSFERALRFAHFGDTHVGAPVTMPLCASPDGYPKALAQVHAMEDRPQFILHTGDIITDAFWATRESAVKPPTVLMARIRLIESCLASESML